MTDIASHRHRLTSLSLRAQSMLSVLAWPLGCLAAGTLLWSMMQSNLDERERGIEADAVRQATHISRAYALQTKKTAGDASTVHCATCSFTGHSPTATPALSNKSAMVCSRPRRCCMLPSLHLTVSSATVRWRAPATRCGCRFSDPGG